MKVCPTNLMSINARCNQIAFKMEDASGGDRPKPSMDMRNVNYETHWGDEFHKNNLKVVYHPNGKVSQINLDYQNGKFAQGNICEKYDTEGNNINCMA